MRIKIAILYIYTLISYSILYVFTAFSVVMSLLFNILRMKKAVHGVIAFWSKGSFVILGKIYRVEGKENLDMKKKYIIMANHSSLFDIMAIMAIYPGVSWFGRAYLLKIPLFGKFLKTINYVPMQTTDLRNTKQMVEELISRTANQTLAIFPEGTRTMDGQLNKFRKGFLYVLKATERDILPITLRGFYEFKPKSRHYFNYGSKISARVHTPISYAELKYLGDKEIIERVEKVITSALL